jgi:hypothetical protein
VILNDISVSIPGNRGNSWKRAQVTFQPSRGSSFKIQFQASVGISYLGDIAIDDYRLTVGACGSSG